MLLSTTMTSNHQLLSIHVHIAGTQLPPTPRREPLMLKTSLLMMQLFLDVLIGKFLVKIFSTTLMVHSLVQCQVVGLCLTGDI